MKRFSKFIFSFLLMAFMFGGVFTQLNVAHAQSDTNIICKIFPFIDDIGFTQSLCGRAGTEGEAVSKVAGLVRFGLSLIFIGIIAIAVFYIIKSALKYIQSEGDEGKIQESTKAIKAVFIGVAALIIGILGLVILLAFFGGTNALSSNKTGNSGVDLVDNFLNEVGVN